jgi:hypothetical protein
MRMTKRASMSPEEGNIRAARQRASFAVFLECHDGKIAAQRNYDCFDPI